MKAILAGGCFWGLEYLLQKHEGIIKTRVGYIGGQTENATYDQVKTGETGHAEATEIEFDPSKTSYEDILLDFFRMHDPTTVNQQGNDVGSQYRSVIFYFGDEQKEIAHKVVERVNKSGAWSRPVVTEILPVQDFWPAETYHQDYLKKNPGGYTCHFIRKLTF